jgi:hypothetical protein
MAHDIQERDKNVSNLTKRQHASVVFWAAAQRGSMSGVQAQQTFVEVVAEQW